MQLAIILSVVATLAAAGQAQPTPTAHAGIKLAAIFVAMTTVVGAAAWISGMTVRSVEKYSASGLVARQWLRFGSHAHVGLWVAANLVILAVFDWPQLVLGNWSVGESLLCDELLLLAPILLPLVLSWAAFHEVVRRLSGSPQTRKAFVWLHVRHLLLPPLIPVLVVVTAQDCARLFWPALLQSPWGWLASAVPLGLVVVFFPWLLRFSWRAEPLSDGALRTRLESLVRRQRLKVSQIFVWASDKRVANAAVSGLSPWLRYVFVSDGLLNRLSEDEVEAVFAHELGHIRHRHSLKLLFVLGLPIVSFMLFMSARNGRGFDELNRWSGAVALALAIAGPFYLAVVVGGYARLLELQADAWAVQTLNGRNSVDSVRQATARYVSALDVLARPDDRRRLEWLHPTVANRRRFLQRALVDPRHTSRLDRALFCWDAVLILCVLVPLFCQLFG